MLMPTTATAMAWLTPVDTATVSQDTLTLPCPASMASATTARGAQMLMPMPTTATATAMVSATDTATALEFTTTMSTPDSPATTTPLPCRDTPSLPSPGARGRLRLMLRLMPTMATMVVATVTDPMVDTTAVGTAMDT